MAITPSAEDPVFLREVDEELRRDQVEGLVRRHGRNALIAAIVILALLGGFLLWNSQRKAAREQQAEQLTHALADLGGGDKAKAAPQIAKLASEGQDGYRALALLTQADMAVEGGDDAKAVAAYKRVADDDGIAQPIRDLARVRQAAVAFDSTKPQEIVALLGPLATPGNAWFGSAGEMVAMAQLKLGNTAEATRLFATLARDRIARFGRLAAGHRYDIAVE